jgi:hypothetical protein
MSAGDPIAPTGQEPARFEFKGGQRSIRNGLIGGVVFMLAVALWAWATGRLRHVDLAFAGVMVGCVAGSVLVVGWRILRGARQGALMLGAIELDGESVRWRKGDGSLGFDVPWTAIEHGIVERSRRQILLRVRDAAPVLLGETSGFAELDRFDELERRVAGRVPVEPHQGSGNAEVGRKIARSGLVWLAAGATMYGVNLGLASALHWTRALALIPGLLGATGLVLLLAGFRIGLGRGPLHSPLYNPAYPAPQLRFLLIATACNLVLVAVRNGLAP